MSANTPTQQELKILEGLREHRRKHRQGYPHQAKLHIDGPSDLTVGQKIADQVAKVVGSWKFIVGQTICIIGWISFNSINNSQWDPYPFILLNLILSFQAAYTAPAIMMSQNRQADVDRHQANNDFEVNVKAELEIELLHQKIDMMKEKELAMLIATVQELSEKIDSKK
ncbi:MAG: hypothetical protein RLZZ619_135 [Pseudomonadota bacterium]|jgi:uncharacterized membrane protein